MDISLNNDEIQEAIVNYINTKGISTSGKDVEINIVAGRKGNGLKAEVAITEKAVEASETLIREVNANSPAEEVKAVTPSVFASNG